MDSFKDAGVASYSEKSETSAFENIHHRQIPISFKNLRVLSNNESMLCKVLQMKFDCLSTVDSPFQEDNSSNSLQVYQQMLAPGLVLSVWKDDLTRHVVDAVVNAANERLLHVGGLALALVKAGGQEIQWESNEYISRYGELSVGNIAVTRAGRLPCKCIIHAVGPQWQSIKREECICLLQVAITNILDYVTTSADIETVAIPAISSGIFSFPLPLCTETIVQVIRTYFQEKQLTSSLKEIHLVSNEDPTVDAFKNASKLILEMNQLGPLIAQKSKTPFNQMVVNNLTLQIVQDYIEFQKTDVIVNSLYLSNPYEVPVSRAILLKAGQKMESELHSKMNKAIAENKTLLITKGYNLISQYVYHVIWDDFSQQSQTLSNAMKMCLTKCFSQNIASISFPVLGTGSTKLSKDQAAKIMFDEVLAFANCNLKEHHTVNFVIPPTEKGIWEAFVKEMEKRKSVSQNDDYKVPHRTEAERKSELRVPSPVITLMGTNQEKMSEAEAWIQRILNLQEQHIIENNHIFYLGKKEHDILAELQTSRVSISENIAEKANFEIRGPEADLVKVVMHIEHMLCEVQEERARKRENFLWSLIGPWTNQQPKSQDRMGENTFLKCLGLETSEIQYQKKLFENCGLRVLKVEKIDNVALTSAFQKTKMMMEKKGKGPVMCHKLFQQVPYQFCDVVSRVGFQRMYSLASDLRFGAGIHFTKNLKQLAHKTKETSVKDKYIYVFEAEVLTGLSYYGLQSQIVPPLVPGGIESYDSVADFLHETFVIFNCMQALPLYLWTCIQDHVQPQGTMFSPQQQRNEFAGGSHVYQKLQNNLYPQLSWEKHPSGSSVD